MSPTRLWILSLLLLLPSTGLRDRRLSEGCEPPHVASRPSYLRPGLDWADALKEGHITLATQSPTGVPVRTLNLDGLQGTFALTAVVTNGRDAGQILNGSITMWRPAATFHRSAPGGVCEGTACRDTVWHWVDRFDLVGSGDSALAEWPLAGTSEVASRDSSKPGIEGALGSDGLFEFSLGPGLRSEDGPPRFVIVEATPPTYRGWWWEGAPIGHPDGGHFCMSRSQ